MRFVTLAPLAESITKAGSIPWAGSIPKAPFQRLQKLCPKGNVKPTKALHSSKANVQDSLRYVQFVQKKNRIRRILSPYPFCSASSPKGQGSRAFGFPKPGSLLFLNQGLSSSQLVKMRCGLKRLGINTKKIPLRL